ncbi:MAG: serine/threonine-protein kinase HipA [Oleiphilaceae bacterium]
MSKATRQLTVSRTLSDGSRIVAGELASDKSGKIYFGYDQTYIEKYPTLSPFKLLPSTQPQATEDSTHNGLYGVFGDSLPDGWGHLLMDRTFRQLGYQLGNITALDRLAYMGSHTMGALTYSPQNLSTNPDTVLSLHEFGQKAISVHEGNDQEVINNIAQAGGSPGGARPKALIGFDGKNITTNPDNNLPKWLIKFGSSALLLKHEEGLVESIYMTMAEESGCTMPEFHLFDNSFGTQWLAMKRFDVNQISDNASGRYHMHSVCGLLDADFKMPSLDYEDLIRATHALTNRPSDAIELFRRMIFNLLSSNCDDHSKNFAFIQDDQGKWRLSPYYDVCYTPVGYGEQTTALKGYGKEVPGKTILELGKMAGLQNKGQIKTIVSQIVEVLSTFNAKAKAIGLTKDAQSMISKTLESIRVREKALINTFK